MFTTRYNQKFSVIGGNKIILENEYDPKQGWFDFMSGTVVKHKFIQNPPKPKHVPVVDNDNKIVPEERFQSMYHHNIEGQLCLPFKEFRRIQKYEFETGIQNQMKFIGCDLNEDNEPYYCEIRYLNGEQLNSWLSKNCQGRYKKTAKRVWFEKKNDALMFKLIKSSISTSI